MTLGEAMYLASMSVGIGVGALAFVAGISWSVGRLIDWAMDKKLPAWVFGVVLLGLGWVFLFFCYYLLGD